ncbi:MAG: cytochrome B [Alphaproteobacteria bacterium]|nr:cytochrome B [Alphaproteobacteria bacterium]
MAVKSTTDKYGTVAIIIHWLSALLILVLIGSGFRASGMEDPVAKAAILQVHLPVGISILLLTLARIGWWFWADKKPAPVDMTLWQEWASRLVHVLFYVVILSMAASGIGMMVLSGAGPIIFGGSPETLPDFWDFLPRTPHGIGARVMVALLAAHVGAAFYHHFIKKDGLIWRMWFGRKGEG